MKNAVIRTLSGAGFIVIVAGSLLLGKFTFLALMLGVMSVMLYEFLKMTMGKDYRFSQLLAILAAIVLFVLTFLYKGFGLPGNLVMIAVIPVFIIMIDSLYVKDKAEFGKFANLYTALLYIAVPMSVANFAVFSSEGQYDGLMLLCFFIIIWGSDVGAYLFGCTLGQKYGKKLFPSISPKKSWIGFWGGFVMAVGVALALHWLGLMKLPLVHCLALGVILDISGVYGDLFESQWKRHYCVKDSGNSIPGHGGFLDRFDSSLTAIPMGVIYLMLVKLL